MRRKLPFLPTDSLDITYQNPRRCDWVESSSGIDTGQSHEFLGVSVTGRSIAVFGLCAFTLLSVYFLRTTYLQIFEGKGFAILADRNKVKVHIVPARRGVLYDRSEKILAHNVPNFVIEIIPTELPRDQKEREALVSKLGQIFHLDPREIESRIAAENQYQPFELASNVTYENALKFSVELTRMKGVELVESQQRRYATDGMQSLSHILGYTGKISEKELASRSAEYYRADIIGKIGIETTYEKQLRGTFGARRLEVDALGTEKGLLTEELPVEGKSLILSIDADLQKKSEEILAYWMKEAGKKRGVVIASQPSTGDILALVNLPTYDSNTFARGISSEEYGRLATDPDKPLFERALNGEYPSGSTIKPIVAVAGLQEGIITGATRLMSSGGIRFGQWLFPDWKPGGHGITDVVKAIAESVNTFFYAIGGGYGDILGLGPERLLSYFRLFGLGSETGVDAQEKKGFVPSPEWKRGKTGEPWYIGDTYHVAIGQGDVSVTPLQVNLFTSYFANGGVNYQPRFVRESIDTPTGHRTQIESKVYRKDVVASQHVALVREGMRQTVVSGSGRRLSLLPVSAAGKTGTAQWNTTKPPHAWFTGWAPFENPAVVITVLVEEGEEGSRIASPVAYEILKWYFEREQRAGDKK